MDLLPEHYLGGPPAMQCDVTLAAAQYYFGGMAVGADMKPLDIKKIASTIGWSQTMDMGHVIWDTYHNWPCNGGSYFPEENEWIRKVVEMHRDLKPNFKHWDVSSQTGPKKWKRMMTESMDDQMSWNVSVRDISGKEAFLYESGDHSRRTEGAWIDPGFYGDWKGRS